MTTSTVPTSSASKHKSAPARARKQRLPAELQHGESVVAGTRRIFLDQVRSALDSLRDRALSDESIHEARKAIKRSRATLRLLRPAIGDKVYREENGALRDAARPLTHVRDAKILVDALEQLQAHCEKAAAADSAGKLHAALQSERSTTRKSLLAGTQLDAIRSALRGARQRVQHWPILEDDWDALGPALRRIYKRGRNAFAAAQAERSDEALHEWRKQTKYLWHALQILRPLRPGFIAELADRAHRLADALGDDHDLAVLRTKVRGSHAAAAELSGSGVLLESLDRCRTELQDKAVAAGEELYRQKPSAFVARLEDCWEKWRRV